MRPAIAPRPRPVADDELAARRRAVHDEVLEQARGLRAVRVVDGAGGGRGGCLADLSHD